MISTHQAIGVSTQPEPVSVMGVPVVPFRSYGEAVGRVAEAVASGRKSFWVAVNPQKIHRAMHEPKLWHVLQAADVGICDGVGVAIASKLLHGKFLARCTGCDLFFELLSTAEQRGWKVFLLGASAESNALACEKLRQRYPGLRIVGSQDGYFEDSSAVIEKINASGADLLFVAMGSPKQEYWIHDHRDAIDARFCMGVGGSFNVASGVAKRAPKIFQKTGTEFLFQLVTEPHRWKRQIVYVPYMLKVIKEALSGGSRAARPEA